MGARGPRGLERPPLRQMPGAQKCWSLRTPNPHHRNFCFSDPDPEIPWRRKRVSTGPAAYQNEGARATQTLGSSRAANPRNPDLAIASPPKPAPPVLAPSAAPACDAVSLQEVILQDWVQTLGALNFRRAS